MNNDVVLGIGDDAAIVSPPAHQQLVVCVDTLVSGQHFLADTSPLEIGYRALAVNLSDIAAMGAHPRWFTLALTLPQPNEEWLAKFSRGLLSLAQEYQVSLIGGDTTQGPLTVSVQIIGTVPAGQALTRKRAKVGDKIYVTGCVGDAGLGLQMLQHQQTIAAEYQEYLRARYEHPQPRVHIGQLLRGVATSVIDISDGLAADLNHILEQSDMGACVYTTKIPLSAAMTNSVTSKTAVELGLTAGDDYELCFSVSAENERQIMEIEKITNIPCTCIGEITAKKGLQILDENGKQLALPQLGWECLRES